MWNYIYKEGLITMIDIKQEGNTLRFTDKETGYPVIHGGDLSISYTLKSDDITKFPRNYDTTPYESRTGVLTVMEQTENGFTLSNQELKTNLTVTQERELLWLELTTENEEFSEFGLNLPFNFMGKLQGGGYENQYLFNSPYRSSDEQFKYCYLKNINGNDLMVLFTSPADGWKMDYSRYVGGHYFVNLKILANFDQAYGTGSQRKSVKIVLYQAKGLQQALLKATTLLSVPALCYDQSFTFDGTGELTVLGECDYVEGAGERFYPQNGKVHYTGADYKTVFTPYYQGKPGMDCSVFGYENIFDHYRKANDVIAAWKGLPSLGNACEAQCWVGAMLKYMLRFGRVEAYDKKLQEFFDVFLTTDEEKAVVRMTLFEEPHGDFPAYSIYKSRRIQEHHFAVSMLLDAYRLYGEEKYLRYAVGTMNSLIDHYQKEDGRLETGHGGKNEDYSTVCCLIIPYVDMTLFFKDKDPVLYEKYRNSAQKLAQHIYDRGFTFPTEGGDTDEAEEQMEDGSISCSALALLYYCAKLERREDYIRQAKAFLDFHEGWVMETPDANMFRSSLRWWETRWEGDADGPALCCGHGWTIWRSEADYWYYKLTGDEAYWKKALCGFTTNFAKFDREGHGKSIYHADYITGGGFGFDGTGDVKFRIAPRFPDREDVKTARYAWLRAADSILTEFIAPLAR